MEEPGGWWIDGWRMKENECVSPVGWRSVGKAAWERISQRGKFMTECGIFVHPPRFRSRDIVSCVVYCFDACTTTARVDGNKRHTFIGSLEKPNAHAQGSWAAPSLCKGPAVFSPASRATRLCCASSLCVVVFLSSHPLILSQHLITSTSLSLSLSPVYSTTVNTPTHPPSPPLSPSPSVHTHPLFFVGFVRAVWGSSLGYPTLLLVTIVLV